MSSEVTYAGSVKGPIGRLGGAFMISRYAKAAAVQHGLTEDVWSSYFVGRCGVLGDVDADVVTAAVAFYPADVVRIAWDTGRRAVPPAGAAARYAQACHEWGRARLAEVLQAARLAELAELVADGAEVTGLPLFAGWRAMPRPADPPARAAHALHVLREHRGGLHALAVVAVGLTPRQAVLAGPGGAANARFFGWPGPYEDVADVAELRAAAEDLTDRLAGPAFAVLDAEEQAELAALLDTALGAASS